MPFWARKKVGFTPLTDNSYDSLSYNKLYSTTNTAIQLSRNSSPINVENIDWDIDYVNKIQVNDFINISPEDTYTARLIFGQKTSSGFGLTGFVPILRNQFGDGLYTSNLNGSVIYTINGGQFLTQNKEYFSVTCLFRSTGTVSTASQPLFYSSTAATSTRVRASLNINQNPTTGMSVSGRRATADSVTTISATHDCTNWTVATAIFNYKDKQMILRINGIQVAINSSFGSGANSENTVAITVNMGRPETRVHFAGATFWTEAPSSFSQLQEVENRYMQLAGII
jgi:hypothetical protein